MPGGRPRKEFPWDLVETMATLQASEEYVAERLCIKEGNLDYTAKDIRAKVVLLQRRIKERFHCSYVQYREQKMGKTKLKLRQLQWKSAEDGNVTMQIWLGKNMLDQTDKQHLQHDVTKETLALSYSIARGVEPETGE